MSWHKRIKTNRHLLVNVFFGSVALVAIFLYLQKPAPKTEQIPGFGLEHFDGTSTRLENYRGRPIIINFWAAWCAACRNEMPIFEKIYQKYKGNGLMVFGVHRSGTESEEVASAFARTTGVTYPLIKDKRTRIFNHFNQGLTAIPTTIFIDRNSNVFLRVIGPRTEKEFFELAEKIL